MSNASPNPWAVLPRRWLHVDLPGHREHEGPYATYSGFPVDELPPIPVLLDDNCEWLVMYGSPLSNGLDQYECGLGPAVVLDLASRANLTLPPSFERFMSSPELQSRVRSCTDCYLDPGERTVETIGAIPGTLLHFLSDSQSCAHWYLHALPDGNSAVLESADLYCYEPEHLEWIENPACRSQSVDVTSQDFTVCAASFSEFLYRFWIENEIWYASYKESRRPLTQLELQYVKHYDSLKHKA